MLDGAGCGASTDAAVYGDEGSNTLGHVASHVPLAVPHLRALGLGRLVNLGSSPGDESDADAVYGRMRERSAGKDSVTGHWEIAGVVLERPFPTFPQGFPAEVVQAFERRIGRPTLGNEVASGTDIIERLGSEHLRTGAPIVYTSVDSVCQVAAHEDVVPVPLLYGICEAAFELFARGLGVSRVIARPFEGQPGSFRRTANRHDYALPPPSDTVLDRLAARGVAVTALGKVGDLFAGRGIARASRTISDDDGVDQLLATLGREESGLLFVNLVDLDTAYGHRNDVQGYAGHLERVDARLGDVRAALRASDLLVVTADHGNDPTTPGTDHSREDVPLLVTGPRARRGVALGTRETFADLGQTLAANFGVERLEHGTSFLEEIVGHYS